MATMCFTVDSIATRLYGIIYVTFVTVVRVPFVTTGIYLLQLLPFDCYTV